MSFRMHFLTAAILLGLNACGSVVSIGKLQPGVATEAEATKVAGRKPEYVWHNPDGTRTLDYSNQAFSGTTSMFVTVDAAGKVLDIKRIDVDPVNNDVAPGMSPDQVRRMLGSPRTVTTYMAGEEVWDWNTVTIGGPGLLVLLNVYFSGGKVVRITTKTIDLNANRP
ncbi:hypothetical protein VVD49_02580 [Uliginosibacterium sp. H3]|uniref:Outer membrane protein assembly factor BamE n=1 Tax=Uliginosibacterium silvisoli TaxID=3114758 RepID=A0ABU6JY48_9RHOO|nr:hypothetical protein [Uliginosibacterium sp. H3]